MMGQDRQCDMTPGHGPTRLVSYMEMQGVRRVIWWAYWRLRRLEDRVAGPRHPGGPSTYAGPFFRRLRRRVLAAIRYTAIDLAAAVGAWVRTLRLLFQTELLFGLSGQVRIDTLEMYNLLRHTEDDWVIEVPNTDQSARRFRALLNWILTGSMDVEELVHGGQEHGAIEFERQCKFKYHVRDIIPKGRKPAVCARCGKPLNSVREYGKERLDRKKSALLSFLC